MKQQTTTGRRPQRSMPDRTLGLFDNPYFRTVWARTTDAMALSDAEGIVLAANPAYLQLYGLGAEAVIGQSFACIFPEAARPQAIQRYQEVFTSQERLPHVATDRSGPDDAPHFEATVQRADGEVRMVESRIEFILKGGQRVAMLSIIRDITERKQAEAARHEAEAQFRQLADAVPELIWLTDAEGRAEYFNQRWTDYCGVPFEPTSAAEVAASFLHPEDAPKVIAAFAEAQRTGRAFEVEQRNRSAAGEYRWFLNRAEPYCDPQTGQITRWVGVGVDIHDRKLTEVALQQAHAALEQQVVERTAALRTREAQLRALASELTMAEQAERRRIAQILHDDLQQRLFGVRMLLTLIKEETAGSAQADLASYAQQAHALLGDVIGLTRQLTVDLSPPVLKEEGLADMLQWLATQMVRLHGFQVDVEAAHPYRIQDADMRVLLFQCVRELLFNVVKHAQTGQATVALSEGVNGQLVLQVRDEGSGFDVAAAEARHAGEFGLFSVRERLALFGGRMTIDSAPGQGTRILLQVPVLSASLSATAVV